MIISGSLAIGIVLACGVLLQDDLTWWWRTRSTTRVVVEDPFLGEHVLTDPTAVAHAVAATKRFIRSLPRKPGWEGGIYLSMSAVHFQSMQLPEARILTVRLFTLKEDRGLIRCMGTHYLCDNADLFSYLGEILRPLAPNQLATWRSITSDRLERLRSAAMLSVVAPRTEGLVEFFCDELTTIQRQVAMPALYAMGPMATAATPCLERILSDAATDEKMRDELRRILARIRSGSP